jgi:hypothetical protein
MRCIFYILAICWRQRKNAQENSDSQNGGGREEEEEERRPCK